MTGKLFSGNRRHSKFLTDLYTVKPVYSRHLPSVPRKVSAITGVHYIEVFYKSLTVILRLVPRSVR